MTHKVSWVTLGICKHVNLVSQDISMFSHRPSVPGILYFFQINDHLCNQNFIMQTAIKYTEKQKNKTYIQQVFKASLPKQTPKLLFTTPIPLKTVMLT